MAKPNVVFSSLEVVLAVLGAAWAGVIFANYQNLIHFLDIKDQNTTQVLMWAGGNLVFAVLALIAGLLLAARHPDGKWVGVFGWAVFLLANVPFVIMAFQANGPWYIVLPVTAILGIGQSAVWFYQKPARASAAGRAA